MKKLKALLKAFIYTFKNSALNFDYYKEILQTKFLFTVKYYVMLGIFASLLATVAFGITGTPAMLRGVRTFIEETKQLYPDDFEIAVANGEWSINREEPFVFPMPQKFLDRVGGDERVTKETLLSNFIVFYKDGTIDDLEELDSYMLVNRKNLIVRTEDGTRSYPLENLPEGTFGRGDFDTFVAKAERYVPLVPVAAALFGFLGFMLFHMGMRPVYLALIGLVLWIVSKAMKKTLSYQDAFRIGVHAFTIPLLIETVLGIAQVPLVATYWLAIVNVALGVFAMMKVTEKSEVTDTSELMKN